MNKPLYSIRMHASRLEQHLSGAERLAEGGELKALAADLVERAMTHPRGCADRLTLSVEAIEPAAIRRGRLPDLRTVSVADFRAGREQAGRLLEIAGVAPVAVAAAMTALAAGPAPGGISMRGAMLVDAATGERLESDPARGVRASRMDLTREAEEGLRGGLRPLGLDNPHVREALVLAAKVLAAPGIVAELCWSDDPDYTAGYVAAPACGYIRFPHLKPRGDERGGRAFFVRRQGFDRDLLIDFLERQVMLFDQVGTLRGETPLED